jgi:hypothetical protein
VRRDASPGKLRDELRAESSGARDNDDKYVPLDNDFDADDLAYLELPTDEEAAEAAAEQSALMASYETQRRDMSARRLMTA